MVELSDECKLYGILFLLGLSYKKRDALFQKLFGRYPSQGVDYRRGHKCQDTSSKIRDYFFSHVLKGV